MKKMIKSISVLASAVLSFVVMMFFNIIHLNINYSGSLVSNSHREDYYVKGYQVFFGDKNFDYLHSVLGTICFILFIILITLLIMRVFLKNKYVKYVSIGALVILSIIYIYLAYGPITHVNKLNINYTVLGASRFLSYYSCTWVYHLVVALIAISIAFLLLEIIGASYSFKINLNTTICLCISIIYILASVFTLLSTLEYKMINGTYYVTTTQEFLGMKNVDTSEEYKFRTLFGFAYLAIIISIPLSVLMSFAKIGLKERLIINTTQSILGMFFGIVVIFGCNLHTPKYSATAIWYVGGIMSLCIGIFSLFWNNLFYIPKDNLSE